MALGNLAGRALAAGIGTAFDGKSSKSEEGDAKAVAETNGNAQAQGFGLGNRFELIGKRQAKKLLNSFSVQRIKHFRHQKPFAMS